MVKREKRAGEIVGRGEGPKEGERKREGAWEGRGAG